MARFIRHDDRRIVFKRTGDERVDGLIPVGFGALFASTPVSWLFEPPPPDMYAIPIVVLFAVIGALICVYGLFLILKSEWLVIDLRRGTNRGRRGVLFWCERLDGPLDDFEEIWIVDLPSEQDPNHGSGPSRGSGRIN